MIEAAIVVARLLQYASAAILFGSSLFIAYALPAAGPARAWPRPLLAWSATVLALASLAAIAAQASLFAGSWSDGLTREALGAVITSMDFGKAAAARTGAALLALVLLAVLGRGRGTWLAVAGAGAVAAASLAWMGHAAASESTAHLVADTVHALSAAAWIGALVALVALAGERSSASRAALHRALLRFSAIGPALVAILVLTGLVNAWVLVGPGNFTTLPSSAYGRALLLKLALFAAMLALAVANRFRLTALAAQPGASLAPLRRSLALETGAGLAVLATVAWLGTQVPPATA